jgi:helix-turn-helix protein
MEVVVEPDTVSDHIRVFLDDPQWPNYIQDPHLKQIKRQTSLKERKEKIMPVLYTGMNASPLALY